MKKIFLLCLACLMMLSTHAQRCAVLEFKAGVGISQADVDGISAIFITYFQPAGYTMVERSQIDKAIEEQRFQRSSMTESQMVRIGQILNVSKIVVGDVNIVMGQYNVDARVINVETGTVSATEGATFAKGASYRATMQSLAQKLAGKIAIRQGATVAPSTPSTPTARTRSKVEVLYGYLKIFPNELGVFQAEPTSVIAQINKQAQHGYNNWRIPTNEELSLMRAGNLLTTGETYMTKEHPEGVVLLVTSGKDAATIKAELDAQIAADLKAKELEEQKRIEKEEWEKELVDLGLPSGTKWSRCYYYVSDDAEEASKEAPTPEQWQELIDKCKWKWQSRMGEVDYNHWGQYKITGPNGNSIWIKNIGRDGPFYKAPPRDFTADSVSIYRSAHGMGSGSDLGHFTGTGFRNPYKVSDFEHVDGIIFLCDWSDWPYRIVMSGDNMVRFVKNSGVRYADESPRGKKFRVIPVSKKK